MADRFRVMTLGEARDLGLYELGRWDDEYESALFDFKDEEHPELVTTAHMEPEDVSFYRDLAWVPKLLNKVAAGE